MRLRAITGIRTDKTDEVVAAGHGIHNGMAGDPATYVAPIPSLPVLLNQIGLVDTAQQAVRLRTIGASATRDEARSVLLSMMESERIVVQALADATPDKAASIIRNAGFRIALLGVRDKQILAAKLGAPGTVDLEANVSALTAGTKGRPFFNWEMTGDGGKTFATLPSTPHGRTVVTGLTLLSTYGFRVCVTTPSATGPWSQVISILVH